MSPLKVAVVDDSNFSLLNIEIILQEIRNVIPLDYKAYQCPIAFCEDVVQYAPDVVISDVEMPNKTGYEVVQFVKQHLPATRTILLSTLNKKEDYDNGKQFADNYLFKPVDVNQLRSLLRIVQIKKGNV